MSKLEVVERRALEEVALRGPNETSAGSHMRLWK